MPVKAPAEIPPPPDVGGRAACALEVDPPVLPGCVVVVVVVVGLDVAAWKATTRVDEVASRSPSPVLGVGK
jgi:hypothetical protein